MESVGGELRLVPALSDPKPHTNGKKTHQRRRYRRCKSAPAAKITPHEQNRGSLKIPDSILRKVHPSFKQVAMFLTLYLALGTVCFSLVGDQVKGKKTGKVLDSFYFCIVTMTTVGYGDLVPNSVATKLLACAFVFSGMALVGLILSKAADYLVEKQEILLVKALHVNEKFGPTDIMREVETNRVKYKCAVNLALLLLLMLVATVFLNLVENLDFVDSFYCVCCTITTLGYGDVSFTTKAGRVFAVFWILISTLCLAQFFLSIAELNTERRQRSLVKWVMNRKFTNFDLEAADMNDDGVVDLAEFIVYKLKEMGKISQEDVSLIMTEFEGLDVDQSGSLSKSDAFLAQPSMRL